MYRRVKKMCKEMGISKEMRLRLCHRSDTVCFKYIKTSNSPFYADEDEFKAWVKKLRGAVVALVMFLIAVAGTATAKAEVISGGKSLGGLSMYMERFYESGQRLYTEDDITLLSEVMYHENYCNGDYIMRLTGSVILNRVASEDFPDTIREVVYQKGQYSTAKLIGSKKIPREVRELARDLLIGGSIAPPSVIWQAMFAQGKGIYYTENGEYFCY